MKLGIMHSLEQLQRGGMEEGSEIGRIYPEIPEKNLTIIITTYL